MQGLESLVLSWNSPEPECGHDGCLGLGVASVIISVPVKNHKSLLKQSPVLSTACHRYSVHLLGSACLFWGRTKPSILMKPRSSRSLQGRAWHKGHAMGSPAVQHEVEREDLQWPVHLPSSKTLVEFYTSPSLPDKCYGVMPICMLGPHRAPVDTLCCLPLSSPPVRGALLHEYVAYDTARKHVVLRRRGPAPGDG
ncbi:hypothetical protein QR685DRAFT_228379 [Neurospora intermedia]|uniref:Uncharacterized protein n=1 Tax=Neurospora intermedia TaxID=5142 RepID=A0ABR3DIU9_NEUIN